jgi:DNA polymerase
MSAPRERLIRKLSRIQAFGEKTLFFVEGATSSPVGLQAIAPTSDDGRAAALRSRGRPEAGPLPDRPRTGDPAGRQGDPGDSQAEGEAGRRWRELEDQVRVCTLCRLCEARTNAVFGSGTRHTRLFVIGEGPGEQEDLQGEAFVGRAGQLLTKILQAIGFERDQVFITNIVKCRPPRNRAPLPDEALACAPYLDAQLAIVDPVVILTLGASATQSLLGLAVPISRLRGRVHLHKGIPVIPTYHPAALLRNPEYKRPTWEDVQLLRQVYDEETERRAARADGATTGPVAAAEAPGAGSASSQLELGA